MRRTKLTRTNQQKPSRPIVSRPAWRWLKWGDWPSENATEVIRAQLVAADARVAVRPSLLREEKPSSDDFNF